MEADMKVDGPDGDFGRWDRPLRVRSGRKRSKPVRSAEAALTRFGSVLRGTVRPFELHLWQLHCETLPSGPTPLQGETRGRSALRCGRPCHDSAPFRCRGQKEAVIRKTLSGRAVQRLTAGSISALQPVKPVRNAHALPRDKGKAVTASSRKSLRSSP